METHSVSTPANEEAGAWGGSWCWWQVQAAPLFSQAEVGMGENLVPQLCCTHPQRFGSETEHPFCWVHTVKHHGQLPVHV